MRNDDLFYGGAFAVIIGGSVYGMFKIGWL
jgi:hypothetical protein